jgi:NTP pyrophosphatase (non-canonical NTP hydrolase)
MDRKQRQRRTFDWSLNEFGPEFCTPRSRALRFVEESLELAQAVGLDEMDVAKLVAHVFRKPKGDIEQEFGGVGVTLLALGESLGIDVDLAESRELARVLSKPAGFYRARQEAKAREGVAF